MKQVLRIIILLVLAIGLYWFMSKMKWIPSLGSLFRSSPVLIDETPLLITEIRQIATLMTIEVADEVVVTKLRPVAAGSPKKILEWISPAPLMQTDRLVLVVKGKVYAGTSLTKLDSSTVYVQNDSVSVTIPAATIVSIETNPSGTDIFIEEGKWTQGEINQLVETAKEKLRNRALEKSILNKADQQALLVLQQFLKLQGFQRIRVVTAS